MVDRSKLIDNILLREYYSIIFSITYKFNLFYINNEVREEINLI